MGEALLSHPRACHILSVEQKTTHASKGVGARVKNAICVLVVCVPVPVCLKTCARAHSRVCVYMCVRLPVHCILVGGEQTATLSTVLRVSFDTRGACA